MSADNQTHTVENYYQLGMLWNRLAMEGMFTGYMINFDLLLKINFTDLGHSMFPKGLKKKYVIEIEPLPEREAAFLIRNIQWQ